MLCTLKKKQTQNLGQTLASVQENHFKKLMDKSAELKIFF